MVVDTDAYPRVGYLGFVNCANVTVQGLTLTGNRQGLLVAFTDNSKITGNNLANNWYGILFDSSSDNVLSGNDVANNWCGVAIYRSLYLVYAYSNTVFHNSFVNNMNQVLMGDLSNTWDDGFLLGGNYWSDYDGTDADHDGIGDTAYIIDTNNTDNYPLMGMFSDFNATSDYHVQMICNSTVHDFEFDGAAISFNVSAENGTTGFCRICIPTALMNDTYTVFVNGTEVQYDRLPFSNNTHTYLYFTYKHSTQEVTVVPEFLPVLILPLFFIATLLAVIIYRRKHPQNE
jgi:parallel beta-helix repeat protein